MPRKTDNKDTKTLLLSTFFWRNFLNSFILTDCILSLWTQKPENIQLSDDDSPVLMFTGSLSINVLFRFFVFILAQHTPLVPTPVLVYLIIETILPVLLFLVHSINECLEFMRVSGRPNQEVNTLLSDTRKNGYVLASWHLLSRLEPPYPKSNFPITHFSDALIAHISQQYSDIHTSKQQTNPLVDPRISSTELDPVINQCVQEMIQKTVANSDSLKDDQLNGHNPSTT